jgi:hypothetical protein
MIRTLWKLPFPSSGATDPQFRQLIRRECAVFFPNTLKEGQDNSLALILMGVQAFQSTYLHAMTPLNEAYDALVDLGETNWLAFIKKRIKSQKTSELHHLRIDFDDGPSYEFICSSFRVETPSPILD